ncbi:MAG: hypothetical protein ABL883_12630 [Terricaulis sp.]
MSEPAYFFSRESGRGAAFVTYVLYLVSIPSAGILALLGVVLAYAARATADGAALTHIEQQIRTWWTALWACLGIAILGAMGAVLIVVLIGIPIVFVAWVLGLVVMIWFTVTSALGLIALLDGRGA